MKHVKSLILMLLIPLTMFLGSCSNDLEEEFTIEVIEDPYSSYTIDDIDYFRLWLSRIPENYNPDAAIMGGEGASVPRLTGERLDKGDILRLKDLEPGYYSLTGTAYKSQEGEEIEYEAVGNVEGISDKMKEIVGQQCFIVEQGKPVIVKLVVYLW